jgi:hypothetical protein
MRILLVVQPERFDFYNYLSRATNVEWHLLWYENQSQMTTPIDKLPLSFEKIHYWTNYRTPRSLLDKIQPDKIVFFEIIDQRQIALIVTAKANKIPTFYLEHGAAGDKETAITRWKEITFNDHKLPYFIKRISKSFGDVLRSKFFYYSVKTGFRSKKSYTKYLLLPFKMLKGAPNKVLTHNKFPERVPDKAIVFNEVNYEEFALYTGISYQDALLTGVPFFDRYYQSVNAEKNYIVYIDHPYYEENLVSWTKGYHEKIANTIYEFAANNKIQVYVKLHPRSDKSLWVVPDDKKEYVTVIQFGDYTKLFLEAKLILGFSSSLVTGFLCAKKNFVLLGWHPEPHIFGADFSATALCHVSFSAEELSLKYNDWQKHNLTLENETAYIAFLKKFNYPFDGKATDRVIEAITSHEVS